MGGKGHAIWKEGHTHDLAEGKSCRAQQNASLVSQMVILKLGKRMQLVLLAFSICFFFMGVCLLKGICYVSNLCGARHRR